ncbi:MAG TPA: APC family permease [Ktedonobacterales bacterium]|nr:APC family permease [Ktedonobacterales bacterium]
MIDDTETRQPATSNQLSAPPAASSQSAKADFVAERLQPRFQSPGAPLPGAPMPGAPTSGAPLPGSPLPMPPAWNVDANLQRRAVVVGQQQNRYVRITRPHEREFELVQSGHLVATERAEPARGALATLTHGIKRVLVGTPISTAAQELERLTKIKAMAVLSSDAISSVAYATEASMAVLITAGLGALQLNLALAAAIAAVMVIVGVSYRQTIHAYPSGGGSYIVARDNLGDIAGLVAAAALLIDYVLTVSVSVASGIDALVSAVARLAPYTVLLGVICIAFIAIVNLRGIRESGTIFAAPTYLFIASFAIMIVAGIVRAAAHGGLLAAVSPAHAPQTLGWTTQRLGIVLVLSAFAQGCSAMTGTEAISNGVPAFQKPEPKNAARTLEWMIGTLFTLFLGTTFLAWRFGFEPHPSGYPTLVSQIAGLVFNGGFGWMYYVLQFTTLLILVLAANTSFADFPRLASILARDGFAPHQFRARGDRLAFSVGIVVLAVLSAVLLVIFQGSVDALINLYALGVFTAFTLSQSGMVRRWLRLRDAGGRRWRGALIANAVGAAATALVASVIIFTKFDRGAWVVVVLVPLLVVLFRGIHQHYQRVRVETQPLTPMKSEEIRHSMIVLAQDLDAPELQALTYARTLTPNVTVVHVSTSAQDTARFAIKWDQWVRSLSERPVTQRPGARRHWAVWGDQAIAEAERALGARPKLVLIHSASGQVVRPLLAYVGLIRREQPETTATVVVPEYVSPHWWGPLLRNRRALRLKLALLFQPGVVVTDVPYHPRHTTLVAQATQHLVLVPIAELNRPAIQSLAYARSIATQVIAVHVALDDDDTERLRTQWQQWVDARAPSREASVQRARRHRATWDEAGASGAVTATELEALLRKPPQLIVIDSPYRALLGPLLAYIDAMRELNPGVSMTVILPEYIAAHWWERLLHNQTPLRLKWSLLFRPGVVVTDVPYHLAR